MRAWDDISGSVGGAGTETGAVRRRALAADLVADVRDLCDVEAGDRLSRHVAGIVVRLIDGPPEQDRAGQGVAMLRTVID